MGLICFDCDKEIEPEQDKFMLALEKPYTNLWFHKSCYNAIKSEIIVYLTENEKKVYNYKERIGKKK